MITTIPKSIPFEEVITKMNEALCATHFTNNTAVNLGGAMFICFNSTVLFSGSVIMFRYNSARMGGALNICAMSSVTSNAFNLFFSSNKALTRGGGFHVGFSNYFLTGVGNMYLLFNSAEEGGGISNGDYTHYSFYLLLSGNSYFVANRVDITEDGGIGGAVATDGTFIITGSAIFIENAAKCGGAIHTHGNFNVSGEIKFVNNTALTCGGAMHINDDVKIHLNNVSAIANSNSALCIERSDVIFSGIINISNNTGTEGGGIKLTSKDIHLHIKGYTVLYGNKAGLGGAIYTQFGTELTFSGDTLFSHNTAVDTNGGTIYKAGLGGAIYTQFGTELTFSGDTLFSHNTADTNGGAIYSEYTTITFDNNSATYFKLNTAENGGAIYLMGTSFLTFNIGINLLIMPNLSISYNYATKYGGGIYNEDNIASIAQCSFKRSYDTVGELVLPYCFIKIHYFRAIDQHTYLSSALLFSQNNSADISGSFLYGGLLDRCRLEEIELEDIDFQIKNTISSEPYRLCFCVKARWIWSDCTELKSIEIYPGQTLNISLIALDQVSTSVTTKITAVSASRLNSDQSSQTLEPECSTLSYNLYSSEDTDQLILYPDGPCRDTGLARAVVNVTFRPCPYGFKKSDENCACEDILKEYGANCTIDEKITISKGSEFWVQGLYKNGNYKGLIHYKTCPRDYCKTGEVYFSLENPDTQCDLNRSGLLCGACVTNHSLILGSSK